MDLEVIPRIYTKEEEEYESTHCRGYVIRKNCDQNVDITQLKQEEKIERLEWNRMLCLWKFNRELSLYS